jgi:hypothetical protein
MQELEKNSSPIQTLSKETIGQMVLFPLPSTSTFIVATFPLPLLVLRPVYK